MAILFLGNGLNRLENMTPSWEGLLQEVAWNNGISQTDSLSKTLGYERFEARIAQSRGKDSAAIKREIAETLLERTVVPEALPVKSIYHAVLDLPISDVWTTNYDYAIETVADPAFRPNYVTRERYYSRHRTQRSGRLNVTHLHGECAYPESICLGFEQYAGTLEKIRAMLTRSTAQEGGEGHKFALYDYLNKVDEREEYTSWVFRFFREDIYMVGFGLDGSELDLWWLLTYRAKLKRENVVPIENTIVYYETDGDAKTVAKQIEVQEKQELLSAFDVEVCPIVGGGFRKKYDRILDDIRCRLMVAGEGSAK